MSKNITDRQKEILDFIQNFKELNGYPPTLREIGKFFNISSTFGVKRHLDALVKKGYLNVESNASRGISIVRDQNTNNSNNNSKEIPIVGRVAAGIPITSYENLEGTVSIDSSFFKREDEENFALKVKGDSMIEEGIFEGDLLVITPQKTANNYDIIVAMVDGEATVKTYINKNKTITLLPANKNYSPIVIESKQDFSIIGKVKGVLRWMN
ncbi:MAG: transcriptional repressor LexA [Ignavibacteriales bacterium CG12_big_fil_rev_8_21_14_0_65_30_8]|nr:MAG: transcriptional repressor LexA [Ignavibacteriales bacterium CG12_big_fil_rev_8_21_14_0_65_30_8]